MKSLRISAASARWVAAGHPWVIRDDDLGDTSGFRPGEPVRLLDPAGRAIAVALADPGERIAARVVSPDPDEEVSDELFAERLAAAVRRRAPLLDRTDALRLVHGEADGLPGLFVDRYADVLRVEQRCRAAGRLADLAVDALGDDYRAVILVRHLTDRRADGRGPSAAAVRGRLEAEEPVEVREHGLRYSTRPALARGTGFFADQRDNRSRLAAHAEGAAVLNLFAHTGAFSVRLLHAGARLVHAVDLSAVWLEQSRENIELNELPMDRYRGYKQDALRFLRSGDKPYDIIVIDPPTAAAGPRFWAQKRALSDTIEAGLARLAPAGRVLVCRNQKRGRGKPLAALLRAAAPGSPLRIEPAGPAPDFPGLPGFPEGDSFEGVLGQRSGPGARR